MVREDLIASAVTFLQNPAVSTSPLDRRIAFLQSKNLTQEEIEVALARAGEDPSSARTSNSRSPGYGYQNQYSPQQQGGYGGYQGSYWQQAPPGVLRRDWRDWFVMATVLGGVGYGLYTVTKRYIYPLIAPPTPPQLEQDKQKIDESFDKAFALLEQLSADTEALKASEQSRTQRLDTALKEVETAISELKGASRRREDEARRMNDDVRGLRDLIPRAMEAQKENADSRLKELSTELRSLKTLVGNRMGVGSASRPASGAMSAGSSSGKLVNGSENRTDSTTTLSTEVAKDALNSSSGQDTDGPSPSEHASGRDGSNSTRPGTSVNRAAIPAWQMAAAGIQDSGSGD